MTRLVLAGFVAMVATALAGCGDGPKPAPPPTQESASKMFDKTSVPPRKGTANQE